MHHRHRHRHLVACLAATYILGCGADDPSDDVALAPAATFRSSCWLGTCCPTGTTPVYGTNGDDRLESTTLQECFVADDGDDTVMGGDDDVLLGGPGDDALSGASGEEQLWGHTGNDTLHGGMGADLLVPGPGSDEVYGEDGDDTVIIRSSCELGAAEVLDGGAGNDTLISPWPISTLQAAGVTVTSFETVTITAAELDDLECCEPDTCGDNGTCSAPDGQVSCACDPGFVGRQCQWDAALVVDEFEALAEPTQWQTNAATGLRYRHTTSREQERNEWRPGSFLVELAGLDAALAQGPSAFTLVLPTSTSSSRTVDFNLLGSDDSHMFVEVGPTGVENTWPTFFSYGSRHMDPASGQPDPDLDGALVTLAAIDEDGGFSGGGLVNRPGIISNEVTQVELREPTTTWQIDEIGSWSPQGNQLFMVQWSPSPQANEWPPSEPGDFCHMAASEGCDPSISDDCYPCDPAKPTTPTPTTQCTDENDNDGDGAVDSLGYLADPPDPTCEHSPYCKPFIGSGRPTHAHVNETGKHYGLFGDVVFCTEMVAQGLNWKTELWAQGQKNREYFLDTNTLSQAYNQHVAQPGVTPLIWPVGKCWIMDSPDQARACRDDGICGPFESNTEHPYPYSHNGSALTDAGYLYNYIPDSYRDLAHAVNLPIPLNDIDYPIDLLQLIVYEGPGDFFPKENNAVGTESREQIGGISKFAKFLSVINRANAKHMHHGAHELGHIFGCGHCDAHQYDDGWSAMMTTVSEDDPECEKEFNGAGYAYRFSGDCADTILSHLDDPTFPAGGANFGQTECWGDTDCSPGNGWPMGYTCTRSGYLGVCNPP